MTLTDDIHDSFQLLLKRYKNDYIKHGHIYTNRLVFENMLFVLLKSLYTCDYPYNDTVMISHIPSDKFIRDHIHDLLYDDDDEGYDSN